MNASRTCTESDAKLAHDVPATFSVPANLKQHMRILRKKFGAGSKIGSRCSNVEGAILTLEHGMAKGPAGDFQRANLEASIKRQLTGISRLAAEVS